MWKKIQTTEDIQEFMSMHNALHDSCIKEIRYVSGAYVQKNLKMHAINSKRNLWICLHTQNHAYPIIEMLFENISNFCLSPQSEDFDCVIYDISFIRKQELFYWADYSEMNWDALDATAGTWVIAKEVSWKYSSFDQWEQD